MVEAHDYFQLKLINERFFDEVLLWLRKTKEKGLPQNEIELILAIFKIHCDKIDTLCLKGCVKMNLNEQEILKG